jgi:RNA polymerase sigma-70 factor, ECF subfamily
MEASRGLPVTEGLTDYSREESPVSLVTEVVSTLEPPNSQLSVNSALLLRGSTDYERTAADSPVRSESSDEPSYPPDQRMKVLQIQNPSPIERRDKEVAFASIVNQYSPDLTRYARYVARGLHSTDQEVEEVVQDVFLRVWTKADKFTHNPRLPDALKNWMITITRNLVNDAYRRAGKEIPVEEVIDQSSAIDPIDSLLFAERLEELKALIPSNRQALLLRLVGYSPPEIAHLLGVSESAVHGRVHRGRVDAQLLLRPTDTERAYRITHRSQPFIPEPSEQPTKRPTEQQLPDELSDNERMSASMARRKELYKAHSRRFRRTQQRG